MKYLLYSHNTRGIGHAARNAAIANGISDFSSESSILTITGASAQISELLPENADLIKLPAFDAIEKDGKLVVFPQHLHIPKKELIDVRSSIIKAATFSFKPDAFLVDFSPKGKSGEIAKTLIKIRRKLPATKVYLGVRDIIGLVPNCSDLYDEDTISFINRYYDAIFYYGDPTVISFEKDQYTLTNSKNITIPLIATGYVARQEKSDPRNVKKIINDNKKANGLFIVASAGGGKHSVDFFKSVVKACKQLPNKIQSSIQLLLITGPYFTKRDYEDLNLEINDHKWVSTLNFVSNMVDYISASDIFIGTGGYNTMTEIIAAKKFSIIIARNQVDSNEQFMRGSLFQRLGFCNCLIWDENIVNNIKSQIELIFFDGIKFSTENILNISGKSIVARMMSNHGK